MTTSTPVRTLAEDEALRAFWHYYEPLAVAIGDELRAACLAIPAFTEVIRAIPIDEERRQSAATRLLQRAAIFDGAWSAYFDHLRGQGAIYARMGIEFSAWFDVTAAFRDIVRGRLRDVASADLERARLIADGLNRWLDVSLCTITEAYLQAKEQVILDQQEAIREVSTPVLQIREQVLIMPIIGVVDTYRARQITEAVLNAIRARRARAVVMDITGVPIVDSKVARHLAQTCEAARLMGAIVVVTGISQQIAQTMVTIGADLANVRTLSDLQAGIEEIEHMLALHRQPLDGAVAGARA